MPPWAHGVLTMDCRGHRAAGRRERRVTGRARGRARQGGGGHSHPPSCPPALARPSASPPPGPAAPTAAAGSACRSAGLLSACARPLPRITRPLQARGGRGGSPLPGGSSPQLRLQPVACAVGVLQVALQLLLPLPVGRLLLAQLLVLPLKPQERLPADREGVSRAGDGSPLRPAGALAGRLGGQGWQRDRALGKSPARP